MIKSKRCEKKHSDITKYKNINLCRKKYLNNWRVKNILEEGEEFGMLEIKIKYLLHFGLSYLVIQSVSQ